MITIPRALSISLRLAVLLLLGMAAAQAGQRGVPGALNVEPGTVTEADDTKTVLRTVVTLARPSPDYFICEVRSSKRPIACSSIIFKKGDTKGIGTATVDWTDISIDTTVKLTAFNIDVPDKAVFFTVVLQKKREDADAAQ